MRVPFLASLRIMWRVCWGSGERSGQQAQGSTASGVAAAGRAAVDLVSCITLVWSSAE